MKKIILLSLIALSSYSQNNMVSIMSISRDTVAKGDTTFIYLAVYYGDFTYYGADSIKIQLSNGWEFTNKYSLQQIYAMQSDTITVSNNKYFVYKVPINIPVNANSGAQYYHVACYHNNPLALTDYPVYISELTGIEKYKKEPKYDYYYYDLGSFKLKINLQTKEKSLVID